MLTFRKNGFPAASLIAFATSSSISGGFRPESLAE
jgi:hypothetical protein